MEEDQNYENQRIISQFRFKIGELVMIRNKARTKGDAKWNGPFIVHKLHDRGVVVTLADGKLMPYHESDVKRFKVPVIADHPSGREFVGDIAEEAVERTILGLRFGLFRRISLCAPITPNSFE
jgi:hypothetical protein